MFGEKNSAAEIFEAAASGGEFSRQELSKLTGYSLMTVGKVVSALEKGRLIYQVKHSGGSVGRNMSLCGVKDDCGMLIFDLSKKKPVVTVCDMRLDVKGQIETDVEDISLLMGEGFGYFLELIGGEMVGMACIIPEDSEAEYSKKIIDAIGNAPELTVTPKFASAACGVVDIKPEGTVMFIRSLEGLFDAVLWHNGFVTGTNGRAADISFISNESELVKAVADFSMIADPEAIHIRAQNGEEISENIINCLNSRGIPGEMMPKIVTSSDNLGDCTLMGTAIMLRREVVIKIAEENS